MLVTFGYDSGDDLPDAIIVNEYNSSGTQIDSSGKGSPLNFEWLAQNLQPQTEYWYQLCTVVGEEVSCGEWNAYSGQTWRWGPGPGPQPTNGFLQVFWRSIDRHLYTSWQNPDATWQAPQLLGGLLNGGPAATQLPGTGVIQVFYRGLDNAVWSRWRATNGTWSNEQRIGGVLNGDPIATTLPGVDHVIQLFYRGTNNSIWSRWRMPQPSDGWSSNYWSDEQDLTFPINGDPIAAPLPSVDYVIQLFYRDTNNLLNTRWRSQDGSWEPNWPDPPQQIVESVPLNSDPIAVQVPGTNILELFYTSNTGSIHTIWRQPDGNWQPPVNSNGDLGANGSTLAAVQVPGTDKLLLLFVGAGNKLYSLIRDPSGSWSAPTAAPGDYFLNEGCGLTARQMPGTNLVEIFNVSPKNQLMTRIYNDEGGWSKETPIAASVNSFKFAVTVVPG
jgi:hypothetical protein